MKFERQNFQDFETFFKLNKELKKFSNFVSLCKDVISFIKTYNTFYLLKIIIQDDRKTIEKNVQKLICRQLFLNLLFISSSPINS